MRELGTQQVTDGDQIAVGAIATGARLGRLDQAVHGLDEAIGQAGAEVLNRKPETGKPGRRKLNALGLGFGSPQNESSE